MPIQELLDFIKKSKEAGQTEEQIMSALRSAGWQEGDIEEGFLSAGSSGLLGESGLSGQATQTMPQAESAKPTQNYSDILYSANKQTSAVITPEGKSSKKLIVALVVVFILLAAGASAYYFKDDLAGLQVIKDWVEKQNELPAQVADNNQQQDQNQQAVAVPITEGNQVVATPVSDKPETMPASQAPERQDCGLIVGGESRIYQKYLTAEETASLACISRNFANCVPSGIAFPGECGTGVGSVEPSCTTIFDYEIRQKEGQDCIISQKMSALSHNLTICKIPLDFLSNVKSKAAEINFTDKLFTIIPAIFSGEKITDPQTKQTINFNCTRN